MEAVESVEEVAPRGGNEFICTIVQRRQWSLSSSPSALTVVRWTGTKRRVTGEEKSSAEKVGQLTVPIDIPFRELDWRCTRRAAIHQRMRQHGALQSNLTTTALPHSSALVHPRARSLVVVDKPLDGLLERCIVSSAVILTLLAGYAPSSNGVNLKSGRYLTNLALLAVFLYCPSALVVSN